MQYPDRTIVYVDGFNLYYGAVKGTDLKWLNLLECFQKLLPKNRIKKIKYFTALVSGTPDDPGKPARQLTYVRALRTIPEIEIIDGYFSTEKQTYQKADGTGPVEVIRTKEKRSDVNLASSMLWDAHSNAFDTAVLVSGDSDFLTPVIYVRKYFQKTVGVIDPQRGGTPNSPLNKNANFFKPLRSGVIRSSQFPDQMSDSAGIFNKPGEWFHGGAAP